MEIGGKGRRNAFFSHFWGRRRRGKVPGDDYAFEGALLVGSVAKGLVLRLTAAAKGYLSSPAEAEHTPLHVNNFEVALDLDRTVVADSDPCCSHFHFPFSLIAGLPALIERFKLFVLLDPRLP